jgi:hypothetical protein
MVVDRTRAEKCSAAKKVLEAVQDSQDLPPTQPALLISDSLLKKR